MCASTGDKWRNKCLVSLVDIWLTTMILQDESKEIEWLKVQVVKIPKEEKENL